MSSKLYHWIKMEIALTGDSERNIFNLQFLQYRLLIINHSAA
jgi:hypothetical protein